MMDKLDKLLEMGADINVYFHGGATGYEKHKAQEIISAAKDLLGAGSEITDGYVHNELHAFQLKEESIKIIAFYYLEGGTDE